MSKYQFPGKIMNIPGRGSVSMGGRWYMEMVQDVDGSYYVSNMIIEGRKVENLPEHVDYLTLTAAIKRETGISILKRKDMIFEKKNRKSYAHIDATGGNTAWRNKAANNGRDCRITFKDIENGFTPDFTRYDLITEVA